MTNVNRKVKTALLISTGVIITVALASSKIYEATTDEPLTETTEVSETGSTASFIVKRGDLKLLTVESSSQSVEWPISGRVVPKNTTQLFSEVQGKVLAESFRLKEGVSFRQGETLLVLDSREFALQLEAQRSTFLNILTGIMPDLKSDYPNSFESWLNYIQNYTVGRSLQPLPKTKSEGEKYFLTSNQVYSTFYSIKAQEERLKKFRIVAPFSGLVTEAMADQGSLVSPGQMLGTIINNRSFELEAATGLEVVSKLNVGDQIKFRSNEIEGEWKGTVVRINDIVDTKTQNIPIFFEITGERIRSGMYLEGFFNAESYTDVFSIPNSILTRDNKVLLLKENTIVSKGVELIEFMQDSILVRGLSSKDLLIANQFDVPVEGLKISN